MADLKPIGVKPNQDIVDELERALADARVGKLQGIAVAELNGSGVFSVWYELGDTSILSLLGAAEMLKCEIAMGGMEWDND